MLQPLDCMYDFDLNVFHILISLKLRFYFIGAILFLVHFERKEQHLLFIKSPIFNFFLEWYMRPVEVFDSWKFINLSALFCSLVDLSMLFWFYPMLHVRRLNRN